MPDVFTPAKRSEVMSRIRSTGNAATELRFRAMLRAGKITGWRRHVSLCMPHPKASARHSAGEKQVRRPRVRPDFVFRKERVVVFNVLLLLALFYFVKRRLCNINIPACNKFRCLSIKESQ